MNRRFGICLFAIGLLLTPPAAPAEVETEVERNGADAATSDFKFEQVPRPSKTDRAARARFSLVSGKPDPAPTATPAGWSRAWPTTSVGYSTSRSINPARAKYTDSYHTTGAFLDYVVRTHDKEFVKKLDAAMRHGKYTPELWKEHTGKTVDELWADYVKTLEER